jgi:ribonuclease HII
MYDNLVIYHCVISNCTQFRILVKWKTSFMPTFKRTPDFACLFYEHTAWQNQATVFGVDEVGRGCLAGPVVTATVMLKANRHHELLQDSKLLSPKERACAYAWLLDNSYYAVSFVHNKIIDDINIYRATLQAMKRSTMQLLAITPQKPEYILVDAMPLNIEHTQVPVIYFNGGESLSSSIAAASIIAKITRDALMGRLDKALPGYNLGQHKGYGTKLHKQALELIGPSTLHRKSFLP